MGVALRDILADYKHPALTNELPGTGAVDAYNALYQFLSIIRQPDGTALMDKEGRITSHLSGIFFRTTSLLEMGVMPVWVFDGKPPELKAKTISARQEVRKKAEEHWEEAQKIGDNITAFKYAQASSRVDEAITSSARKLLALLGIPTVDAPTEGEAQAAYMAAKGDVDYVVSQDYDTLLFGTPKLIRNLTVSGKRRMHGRVINVQPERIESNEILNGLSISREQLIDIAILVGTDFNSGVKGIGAKTGLKKVLNGEFDSIVAEKMENVPVQDIRELFMNPDVTDDYSLSFGKPDREGLISFLCDDYGFSRERILPVLDKIADRKKQQTLDSWF